MRVHDPGDGGRIIVLHVRNIEARHREGCGEGSDFLAQCDDVTVRGERDFEVLQLLRSARLLALDRDVAAPLQEARDDSEVGVLEETVRVCK